MTPAAGATAAVTNLWIAIPAAIGGAFCFGLTGALQHIAARRVAARPALRPSLLVDLARQRDVAGVVAGQRRAAVDCNCWRWAPDRWCWCSRCW